MTRRLRTVLSKIGKIRLIQFGSLVAIAAALGLAYLVSEPVRSEVDRAVAVLGRGESGAIRDYLRSWGAWGPVVSVGLMVAQALVAPVPHFLVVFGNGLAFGVGWGWAVSMVGQTVAAAVCFGIARAVGRGPVEALVGRFGLETADRWFARWGTAGVLVTRLLPGIGFDGVSFAAGLTRIGFGPFLAVTAVGSAPQALLYAYLGQRAPQAAWWLLAASVLVAAAVGAAALLRGRRRRVRAKLDAPVRRPVSCPAPGLGPRGAAR